MEGRFVTWVGLQLTENLLETEEQNSNQPYHERKTWPFGGMRKGGLQKGEFQAFSAVDLYRLMVFYLSGCLQ